MTKRDFFIVLIKIFGLFFLIASISVTMQSISFVFSFEMDFVFLLSVIIGLAIVIGIFLLLIFKSDKIVHSLKLDKGFDEERIEFGNLTSFDVVRIATFIIGGILLIDNIPDFITQTVLAFKGDVQPFGDKVHDNYKWAISGTNIIIGYLLITNYYFIAKLFRTKDKKDILE